jgi:hypothetical protein
MTTSKSGQYWMLTVILLIAVSVAGSIVAWARYSPSQPIEIRTPPKPELQGEIYIAGAVATPGFYPLQAADSIETLVRAAGGITSDAGPSRLNLYISRMAQEETPQKVDTPKVSPC